MIKFIEQGHVYQSIESDHIKWLGVTTLVKHLHEEFNSGEVDRAFECSIKKPTKLYPNKWYGIPPSEIEAAWEAERNRSTELGHWYHGQREAALLNNGGLPLVYKSDIRDGIKYAPNQTLSEGIYPEHLMYLLSAQICGQSDYVEVKGGKVHIRDYKTSKEIKRHAFVSRMTGTKMMFSPVEHLEDCHYSHYNLQLSLYMYMILRHNPNLEPGTLTIEHIKFEEESRDKYDYPIYKKDGNGGWVIKEIEEISMPYLKKEVVSIIEWLKHNKANLLER